MRSMGFQGRQRPHLLWQCTMAPCSRLQSILCSHGAVTRAPTPHHRLSSILAALQAAAKAAAAADAAAQEVDSARADSTTATGTNTACGPLLGAALHAADVGSVQRRGSCGEAAGAASVGGRAAAAPECDSPCSAERRVGDGPAAAALARRKGEDGSCLAA